MAMTMNRLLAAGLLWFAAATMTAPAFGAGPSWESIKETHPPRQQPPAEINTPHEAYLRGYHKIGAMVVEGTSKAAALDKAAGHGAHLVYTIYHEKLFDKLVNRIFYETQRGTPGGFKWSDVQYTTEAKYTKGYYVEMYVPGADYQEGFDRFCEWRNMDSSAFYTCGDTDLMKRYFATGIAVDRSHILASLALNAAYLARSSKDSYSADFLPGMQADLEMIDLASRHGADPAEGIKTIEDEVRMMFRLEGNHRPGSPGELEWSQRKIDPQARLTSGDRQAFLYEAHRLLKAARK